LLHDSVKNVVYIFAVDILRKTIKYSGKIDSNTLEDKYLIINSIKIDNIKDT